MYGDVGNQMSVDETWADYRCDMMKEMSKIDEVGWNTAEPSILEVQCYPSGTPNFEFDENS